MESERALKVLIGEIRAALESITANSAMVEDGSQSAGQLAERVELLQGYLSNLQSMQQDWSGLMTQPPLLPGTPAALQVRGRQRVTGIKTHARYFRLPILRALTEMGGSATTAAVLDRVGELLADRLNDFDDQRLPGGHKIRWRNTAQWVHNTLKKEGLVRTGTTKGIWQITSAGAEYLNLTNA